MSDDNTPTPLSQQAAEPVVEPPSWQGPVQELRRDVDELKSTVAEKLTSIDGSLSVLIANATKDPDVRRHLLSILGSIAVILSIVAAALAGRASSTPPAPAPAITVVVPKEAHS